MQKDHKLEVGINDLINAFEERKEITIDVVDTNGKITKKEICAVLWGMSKKPIMDSGLYKTYRKNLRSISPIERKQLRTQQINDLHKYTTNESDDNQVDCEYLTDESTNFYYAVGNIDTATVYKPSAPIQKALETACEIADINLASYYDFSAINFESAIALCAKDFHDNHGGKSMKWPLVIIVYLDEMELARKKIYKTENNLFYYKSLSDGLIKHVVSVQDTLEALLNKLNKRNKINFAINAALVCLAAAAIAAVFWFN